MLFSIGIIGNILVVVWRLAQKRDQRSSPLSILIIMLAVSDFLYCVHLILLESLVLDASLDQTKHLSPIFARNMCMTSALLSWFSCLTAQWATFNIAVYSFQAMNESCSGCCCSLVYKRNLVITIICQVLINVVIIVIYTIVYDKYAYSDFYNLFYIKLQDYDLNTDKNLFPNVTQVLRHSRRERIAQIFGRCAWALLNGFGYCIYITDSLAHDNHLTIYNDSIKFCTPTVRNDSLYSTGEASLLGSIIASLGTVLTLTCAILYTCFWISFVQEHQP